MHVEAEWSNGPQQSVHVLTPEELVNGVASHGATIGRSGVVFIEAVDVRPADLTALGRWCHTLAEVEDRDLATMEWTFVRWLGELTKAPGVNALSGGGLGLTGWRVPVVRLTETEQAAVSSRELIVVIGQRCMMRLWLPVADPQPGNDPRWLDERGEVLEMAEQLGQPSWLMRCPNRIPVEAAGWELRCAANSHLRAIRKLTERLGAWQTDAWTAFAGGTDANAAPDAAVLANLARWGHTLQLQLRDIEEVADDLDGDDLDAEIGPLFGLTPDELPSLRESAGQARVAGNMAHTHSRELARTVQDAMGVVATASLHRLMEAGERQQRQTARFERRVAILAGVLTGPAIVAGLAGANTDFWPLPTDGEVLAKGALPCLVVLCVLIGAAAWRYLRPEPAEDTARDQPV